MNNKCACKYMCKLMKSPQIMMQTSDNITGNQLNQNTCIMQLDCSGTHHDRCTCIPRHPKSTTCISPYFQGSQGQIFLTPPPPRSIPGKKLHILINYFYSFKTRAGKIMLRCTGRMSEVLWKRLIDFPISPMLMWASKY